MSKILTWILSFTKIGKVVEPIQKFLVGYKSYLAGLALVIPALLTILQKFSDQGLGYLTTITATEEWIMLVNGLGIMGIRAAIAKAS